MAVIASDDRISRRIDALGHASATLHEHDRQQRGEQTCISLLEIAMLHQRRVIELKLGTAKGVAAFTQRLVVLPIDAQIAADAANSLLPQGDPFDRVIVATAQRHELILVTRDERIVDAKLVPTSW